MKRKIITDFLVSYTVMRVTVFRVAETLELTDRTYKPTIASMGRLQYLRDTYPFKVYQHSQDKSIFRYQVEA